MAEEAEVWKSIGDSERDRLLERLAAEQVTVSLEAGDVSVTASARKFENGELHVELQSAGAIPLRPNSTVKAKFQMGGEVCFFHGTPVFEGNMARIAMPAEIFRLQRRKIFRMNVPESFPSKFEVSVRETGRMPLGAQLKDINATGLAFEVPAGETFHCDERIEGEFQLGERKFVKIAGTIRYARTENGRTQIGVQFDHTAYGTADIVNEVLLFFRHDVFHHQKKGSK